MEGKLAFVFVHFSSRKLLFSRKRDTIYTKSSRGFSLRISKLLSVGGSSLKWSKSIEKNSKRANEVWQQIYWHFFPCCLVWVG